jgi:hypothetical protein
MSIFPDSQITHYRSYVKEFDIFCSSTIIVGVQEDIFGTPNIVSVSLTIGEAFPSQLNPSIHTHSRVIYIIT